MVGSVGTIRGREGSISEEAELRLNCELCCRGRKDRCRGDRGAGAAAPAWRGEVGRTVSTMPGRPICSEEVDAILESEIQVSLCE